MSDHKLEKEFREKLDGHISPIDSDALWADLQEKRGVKKPTRRKRVIWTLLGLLLLGGIYCTISNLNTRHHTKKNTNVPWSTSSISESNIKTSSTKSTNDSKSQHSIPNEIEGSKVIHSESSEVVPSKDKTQVVEPDTKSILDISTPTTQNYNVSSSNINHSDEHINQHWSPNSNMILQEHIKQDGSVFKINGTNTGLKKTESNIMEDEQTKADDVDKTKQYNVTINKNIIAENTSWLTNKIPLLGLSLVNNDIEQPHLKRIPSDLGISKFEIGASFNYEYAFRNLKSTASEFSSVGPAYADLRSDSEKFIESYRASLFLRHNFKHNFRASVGIEYTQLTERFDSNIFLGSELRIDSTISVAPVKFDSFRVRKIHNRYTSLNIPIQIGKSFGKKRLSYFLDIGAMVNISFEKSGQIFSNSQMNPDFLELRSSVEELQEDLFKVSYMAHAGLSYQLDNKTKLELGPQFHSSFTPELRINSIETSRSYLGLRFNLVRRL